MTLNQLRPGETATIVTIGGGTGLRQRLRQMGLHPGDTLAIASTGAFRGPVLIGVHGMQIALGQGVARKIVVELASVGRKRAKRGGGLPHEPR